MIKVLDHGHVQLVEKWGSDENIIRAARQSTQKGFEGWVKRCVPCSGTGQLGLTFVKCEECGGGGEVEGDSKLLRYLYTHNHMTPFEMAGAIIEVKAPLMVFREWHRHRTQSYNEASARYAPLPDVHYQPELADLIARMERAATSRNKQEAAENPVQIDPSLVEDWLVMMDRLTRLSEATYQRGLEIGVPKELARLSNMVNRYSQMWAQANLRNWMHFLTLRQDPAAQQEIRLYADAVCSILETEFPRTMSLFKAGG